MLLQNKRPGTNPVYESSRALSTNQRGDRGGHRPYNQRRRPPPASRPTGERTTIANSNKHGKKIEWAGAAALVVVALLPAAVLPGLNDAYSLPKSLLLRGAAIVLATLLAFSAGLRLPRFRRHSPEIALAVLAAALIAGAVLSSDPLLSFFGAYRRHEGLLAWFSYLLVFWGATRFGSAPRRRLLVEAISWITAGVALVAIAQYLAADAPSFRVQGTFGNASLLGAFLVLAVPAALALLASGDGRARLAGGLGAGGGLVALYLTFTRGAWLAVLVALVIVAFGVARAGAERRAKRTVSFGVAAIVGVILIVTFASGGPAGSYTLTRLQNAAELDTGTTASRLEMWRETVVLIKERPVVGYGLETFRDTFLGTERLAAVENVYRRADRPHNHFLYLAFASGLIGAAAYYAFLAAIIWTAFRGLSRTAGRSDLLLYGLMGGVIGYQVQAEFLFSSVGTSPIWWLFAGLLVAGARDTTPEEPGKTAAPATSVIAPAVGVLLFALLLFQGGRAIYADYHFTRGLPGRETGAPEYIRELETAVGASPDSRVYRLALGHAYLANGKSTGDRRMVERAIDVYLDGLEDSPSDEFYYSLGDAQAFYAVAWDRARFPEALAAYEAAAELRPFFPYTYWEMGYIHMEQGRTKEAVPLFKRSLELDPLNTDAWNDLGRAHESLGRPTQARRSYERALSLDPQSGPAIDGLDRVR